jgi:hypothetical protein
MREVRVVAVADIVCCGGGPRAFYISDEKKEAKVDVVLLLQKKRCIAFISGRRLPRPAVGYPFVYMRLCVLFAILLQAKKSKS